MKKKVPGHGRSRDEEPAGRAGPRRICQSPSQFLFRDPIFSESSKDLAIRPNPYFTREVSGGLSLRLLSFSFDFLYEKKWCCQYVAGGLRLDFLYTEHGGGAEIAILSTQRIPERRPCQKIAVLFTCT